MGKRKANSEAFIEDEDTKPSKRVQKQKNKVVEDESDSEYSVKKEADDESEQDEILSEKPKSEKKVAKVTSDDIIVKTTSEGDKYLDLGKKKRITVRSFKGTPLIDIREFYGNDGDEKPGKKGISLTLEQWETLKKSTETLDGLFAAVKKK